MVLVMRALSLFPQGVQSPKREARVAERASKKCSGTLYGSFASSREGEGGERDCREGRGIVERGEGWERRGIVER